MCNVWVVKYNWKFSRYDEQNFEPGVNSAISDILASPSLLQNDPYNANA